jgi:DNA (cytosine-5)-methyltransferase 1
MLTSRGLGRVLGDLASMGFDARWGVLGAADVGAKHQRDRIWIVATSNANNINDALRGDSENYEEGLGKWGVHPRGSVSDSGKRCEEVPRQSPNMANAREIRPCGEKTKQGLAREFRLAECGMDRDWWQREPEFVPRTTQRNMGGVADGVASRVDRLKAIGNGQVPLCAATSWRILSE